jgi:hypothetical protein
MVSSRESISFPEHARSQVKGGASESAREASARCHTQYGGKPGGGRIIIKRKIQVKMSEEVSIYRRLQLSLNGPIRNVIKSDVKLYLIH